MNSWKITSATPHKSFRPKFRYLYVGCILITTRRTKEPPTNFPPGCFINFTTCFVKYFGSILEQSYRMFRVFACCRFRSYCLANSFCGYIIEVSVQSKLRKRLKKWKDQVYRIWQKSVNFNCCENCVPKSTRFYI